MSNNSHVVPYSPFLSKKYNAFINVDICSTVQAVKYMSKYNYKGPDKVLAEASQISSSKNCISEQNKSSVVNVVEVDDSRKSGTSSCFSSYQALWARTVA